MQWECKFEPPEDTRVEEQLHLRTRDARYGARTDVMRLHYRVKECEKTIQYVDVMSLFPSVCKHLKFTVRHPKSV